MYGIYLGNQRPKSKKDIKAALAENPASVGLQGTSLFGGEYSGPVSEAPDGVYTFVGPDPYLSRKFYGNITVKGGKAKAA